MIKYERWAGIWGIGRDDHGDIEWPQGKGELAALQTKDLRLAAKTFKWGTSTGMDCIRLR